MIRVDENGRIYTDFEEEYQLVWVRTTDIDEGSYTLASVNYIFREISRTLQTLASKVKEDA